MSLSNKYVLIIGANGGIAQALIDQLTSKPDHTVVKISRTPNLNDEYHYAIDSSDEGAIKEFLQDIKTKGIKFDSVICTTGVLHTSGDLTLKPEKRLEDINLEQFEEYFRVNTVVPALWLKHLVRFLNKQRANVVFFSARVGSISENGLGGWYGYRASKAALNMVVKTASIEYKRRAPNTILSCYHPGTVDTALSKPFQSNVKPGKLFTADFTAGQLLSILESLSIEDGPYYFDWEGKSIQY